VSAASLETALREIGIACAVEAHDRLAMIIPDDAARELGEAPVRRETLRIAREHGFSHVALELLADPADRAALHRD
jgi:hypothetical protein